MYQKAVLSEEIESIASGLPGVKIQTLHTDEASGATTVMTHIAAGAAIPEHWHTSADETVFVVSGDSSNGEKAMGPDRSSSERRGLHMAHMSLVRAAQS
jgi:anti-sigma factor ChrR (cupin superfamily)